MELMTASQAARYLGIKRPTLYAYVSRGLIESVPQVGGVRGRGYRKCDLDRLRRRRDAHFGHGAAAAGALEWGAPSLQTAVSRIADDGPAYRGRPMRDLVRDASPFEAVAELLWTGVLPAHAPTWFDPRPRPTDFPRAVRENAHPIDALRIAVMLAALDDPARFAVDDATEYEVARRLVATAVDALAGPGTQESGDCRTTAASLVRTFGLEPGARVRRALDAALVIIADHELNASTFAARVAASTGADLYACVGAALATVSGPRHGGACDRCAALLRDVEAAHSFQDVLRSWIRRGESPPGFGHRLYPGGDPRFSLLVEVAEAASGHAGVAQDLASAASELELGAPTCDMGLVLLARALGIADSAAVTIFAVGRMAGWIAHALEQRRQGFLLRPRARYVGTR